MYENEIRFFFFFKLRQGFLTRFPPMLLFDEKMYKRLFYSTSENTIPWIFKYMITKLYLFHTSAIFGHFLQTCNKKLTSKDISKSAASKIGLSNGFFLSLLLRSVNYEMHLCCLQILPKKKNENKSTWGIIVSNKVKNFRSFFWKNWGYQKVLSKLTDI